MIWFFSDPHYAHKNIIRGTSEWPDKSGCRPFDSFQEYHNWLVDEINSRVMPNDVAWCLGDWSFGGEHRIAEFRHRLNCGDIHLILGNHDHHIAKAIDEPEKYGFHSIRQYAELDINKIRLVLFHYPIESWHMMERGAIHLHGHTHGKTTPKAGRYEVSPEAKWILSLDDVARLPKATDRRHPIITGGSVFGIKFSHV